MMNRQLLATAIAVVALFGVVAAQVEDAAPGADGQATLRTESYQLFAVEESGVTGTLNVTERLEGGSQLVVTLVGIEAGNLYLPVLHQGDCGPDRERVLELPPVGSMTNDPFSSISESSISFDELTEGDYFLYIFRAVAAGEETGQPLACGEVGAGANR